MRHSAGFLLAVPLVLLASCTDTITPPPESAMLQSGTITGQVFLDPDIQGTVANAVVELYCSCECMIGGRPAQTVLAGENGQFSFDGLCCGTYFVGVWKDNDANGMISSGDLSFDRSTPEQCCCRVPGGCTVNHVVSAIVVQ